MLTEPAVSEAAVPRKRGGQPGNKSGLRHGLSCCRLPKKCKHIERSVRQFRAALEEEVIARNGGTVSKLEALLVNSACRAEQSARLAQRHFTKLGEDITTEQLVALQKIIVNASEARDRKVRELLIELPRLTNADEDAWPATFSPHDEEPAPADGPALAPAPTVQEPVT